MGDTTLPAQPKPVQDRALGENLHKDLHSYPCRGRKSSEIQEVTVSREALKKVRGGLGFSENGSRHHLNNGAGPPAPPRTRSQERGGPMPASLSIPSPALEGG